MLLAQLRCKEDERNSLHGIVYLPGSISVFAIVFPTWEASGTNGTWVILLIGFCPSALQQDYTKFGIMSAYILLRLHLIV